MLELLSPGASGVTGNAGTAISGASGVTGSAGTAISGASGATGNEDDDPSIPLIDRLETAAKRDKGTEIEHEIKSLMKSSIRARRFPRSRQILMPRQARGKSNWRKKLLVCNT